MEPSISGLQLDDQPLMHCYNIKIKNVAIFKMS